MAKKTKTKKRVTNSNKTKLVPARGLLPTSAGFRVDGKRLKCGGKKS